MSEEKEIKKLLEQYNDEFVKFRRNVEDTLENLEFGNFSKSLQKYISDGIKSSAGFEASAGINGATARMFAEYEDQFTKSIAEVKAKADANGAFLSLTANAGGGQITYDSEDRKYYYSPDGINEIPLKDANIAGIFISAINNANNGESETAIKINADIIEFGENASVDSDGNLRIKRLWNTRGKQYYACVGSQETGSWGDFGVYDVNKDNPSEPGNCVWRLYHDLDKVQLEIEGKAILGYNIWQDKTYPKGVWDFSSCTEVRGLGVVPVFAE